MRFAFLDGFGDTLTPFSMTQSLLATHLPPAYGT